MGKCGGGQRGRASSGSSESPQRAAPTIFEVRLVLPPQVKATPVVETSVGGLRCNDEREIRPGQLVEPPRWIRFPDGDQQPAGDVVDAVAMFSPGLGQLGVFEQTRTVAQAKEVLERHRGQDHALASTVSGASASAATSRYCSATAGHSKSGAIR